MTSRRSVPFAAAVVCLLLALISSPVSAEEFETKAKQALMIDADTGTVLFSKDPDAPIAPASLAKLMTMEAVFHAVQSGKQSLETVFPVSENAWRTGGAPSGTAAMFAKLKSTVPLDDLIRGAVVQGANDACIVIAEGFSGSEATFAETMTARAREIGLPLSTFKNATGLPAEGQVTTPREMVALARHIQKTYPEFYTRYAEREFTWNKITQRNRNPLVALNIGVDGLGVGFTQGEGYAIVASVNLDGRRIVAALSGLASERERVEEARKLLDWGMTAFREVTLFAAGEPVGEARVFGGAKSTVKLRADGPAKVLVPADSTGKLSVRIVYDGPVAAPVAEGARIGALSLFVGDELRQQTPLFAAESVPLGSLHQRAYDAAGELLLGWLR